MTRGRRTSSSKIPVLNVLILLLGGTCAGATGDEKLPFCRIDRLDGAISTGGFLEITGFAVDPERGAPVEKMEILLDGTLVGESSLSGLRSDVSSHFHRTDYLWSGWSASVSLEHVSAGRHRLEARAVTFSGIRPSCGTREVQVLAVPRASSPPVWRIGAVILLRTILFLVWLGLIGWFPARAIGSRPVALSAPLLGLALFAIFAETGSALKVRPFLSASVLVAISTLALLVSTLSRRMRLRRPGRTVVLTLVCCVAFAAIAVIPLASHGEGAVLGDIDDAARECSVADSMQIYGFQVPSWIHGYLAAIPDAMRRANVRLGGSFLLAALGQAFDQRAHAVYCVAMLGTGILIVLGSGLLAVRLLRRFPTRRWTVPALVAMNSTLLAVLFSQHLGNLLSVALFVAFLAFLLSLIRSPLSRSVWPVALVAAAALTLYPETTPVWGGAAVLSIAAAGRARWMRTLRRIALAAFLAVLLNPIGFVRSARFFRQTSSASLEMSSPYHRLIAGDTHYFPSLNVVSGLEAYREDAPAPRGQVRTILIPAASFLILLTLVIGLARLYPSERWLVAALLVPVALALAWSHRLTFPYGFAKFLPLAVPAWAASFLLSACACAEGPSGRAIRWQHLLALGTVLLTFALCLPAARHVVLRAKRAIPSYDPDFRVLPDIAAARIRPGSVIEVDEPLIARREWIRYFLGEWETELAEEKPDRTMSRSAPPRYLLLDRRRPDQSMRITGPISLDFALLPVASNLVRVR